MLPRLLERAGNAERGGITGIYTVLVDGDDFNEPIADAVRSILDGHVVLSRDLAHAGHYPAVDVLASVSRLVGEVTGQQARAAATTARELLAAYRDKQDLIAIGAYQAGTDPVTDAAIALRPAILDFLRQHQEEPSTAEGADAALAQLIIGGALPAAVAPMLAPGLPEQPLAAAIPPLHLAAG